MQQPYIMGLDIGTGSTKAVAVSPSGTVLATTQVHYGMLPGPPHVSEQDPNAIWEAFAETIRQLITMMKTAPQAVGLSSCMHSLILIDAAGKPLTASLTWADRRSASIAAALRTSELGAQLYTATGTPVHAMSPLCKLQWFRDETPQLFQRIFKAISIKEYIWWRLFGVYEVDYSIASATGLFDIRLCDWYKPALQFCGLSSGQLSTPVSTSFIRTQLLPAAAARLNLSVDIPFCIGASDGCLANVGSGALAEGTAAVTIGTSGAVRICSAKPVSLFPDMIFNYRLDDNNFICGGAVNNGGNLLQWLARNFLNNPTLNDELYAGIMQRISDVPAGSEGLLCLPYLAGERTPLWDEKASGAFIGIRPHHTQSHFLRAGLEGVCFALYGVLKKLEAATASIHTLQVSGGLVHAPVWMQLLADVTGKSVSVVSSGDASAVGAALLCYKSLHHLADYPTVATKTETLFEPNTHHHVVYEKYFVIFQKLYQHLQPAMHDLEHVSTTTVNQQL